MSDLAPFVAATIRDKVVADLTEENESLRDKLRLYRRVVVTGKYGSLVHAETDFDCNMPVDSGSHKQRVVRFSQEQQKIPCTLSMLRSCEIYVGGVLHSVAANYLHGNVLFYAIDNRSAVMEFLYNGHIRLTVVVGPISEGFCDEIASTGPETIMDAFVDPSEDAPVTFSHIMFGQDVVR